MITPSFGLTATERVLPKLALDFTTATLDPRVTFTRSGNTATYTNPSGVITAINANLPRFDYNPTTLVCQGLLIEEARTNLLLNSLIDGTSLTTQSVTVAATAYTLSFYGTGSIDLSGTHTATVTGTGAYPSRKTYTFTPTAGTLTLTVTGTVQYAQLEAGAFATSYIPTTTTALTRNADVATMTGSNFSSWYNASEGTFVSEAGYMSIAAANYVAASVSDGTTQNQIRVYQVNGVGAGYVKTLNVDQAIMTKSGITANTFIKQAIAYKQDSFAYDHAGGTIVTDTSGTIPTVTRLDIGGLAGNPSLNGWIKKLNYYPQRLINNEVQSFSK